MGKEGIPAGTSSSRKNRHQAHSSNSSSYLPSSITPTRPPTGQTCQIHNQNASVATRTITNLKSQAKTTLNLASSNCQDSVPCPECIANAAAARGWDGRSREQQFSSSSSVVRRPVQANNTNSQILAKPEPEMLHKGYKMVHHPQDPTLPPLGQDDSDSDPGSDSRAQDKRIDQVIALSDNSESDSSGSSTSSEGSSQGSRQSGKIKQKGFAVIRTRELSPATRKRKKKERADRKRANKEIDNIGDRFRPSYGSQSSTRR